jgi:hypothetical protein
MGLLSVFRSFFTRRPSGERAVGPAAPGAGVGRGLGGRDGVDWAEVRRLYEAGEAPIKAIQARFGVSRRALRQASLEGGWRLRPQIAKPGPRQGQRRHDGPALSRRLLRIAGERLAQLEDGAAAGEARPRPATPEELQAMAELARALQPLMREDRLRRQGGVQSADRKSPQPAAAVPSKQEEEESAHVIWMRAELKRRFRILDAAREEEAAAAAAETIEAPVADDLRWRRGG